MQAIAQRDPKYLDTPEKYVLSLRQRAPMKVYLLGKLVPDVTRHPILRPSVNAV